VIPATPASDEEIAALSGSGNWTQVGNLLEGTFSFACYAAGLGFVTSVGAIAEAQNHHPEITLGFDTVHVRIYTHETNSITARDLHFCQTVSSLR